MLVMIKGAGDIASGIALRLWRAGINVVMTDLPKPSSIRRTVWLERGEEVTVRGEVRTFNNRSGVGSRLVISVFAKELVLEEREDENRLLLSGTLCKPPSLRSTPLGRTICDMILAVNRRYGRADYLPCIAWGSLAHLCGEMAVGSSLGLDGRLQSRTYTKNLGDHVEERTAFEVSIMNLLPLEEVRLGRETPVWGERRGAI